MLNKSKSLTSEALSVIHGKGTEPPYTGKYLQRSNSGTFLCRQCGIGLYHYDHQFIYDGGWPSFDDCIDDRVKDAPDPDGKRTEILCKRCDSHLGHIFYGENLTPKNTRHCINSVSIEKVDQNNVDDTEEAIFAAGCFWGVEYLFQDLDGVLKTEVGYIGGKVDNPTYKEVCSGNTGHFEALRVVFDFNIISYEDLVRFFFEIHDFTQTDGQGPDIGSQYLSAIFCYDQNQKDTSQKIIDSLIVKGYQVSTILKDISTFWPSEDYHQNYYHKNKKSPYCHVRKKIF